MKRLARRKDRKHIPQSNEDRSHRPSNLWLNIEGPSDFLYRIWINRTFRKLIPGLVIFLILLLMPTPDGLTTAGQRTLALFVFIAFRPNWAGVSVGVIVVEDLLQLLNLDLHLKRNVVRIESPKIRVIEDPSRHELFITNTSLC